MQKKIQAFETRHMDKRIAPLILVGKECEVGVITPKTHHIVTMGLVE
jgi:hypothetical protein